MGLFKKYVNQVSKPEGFLGKMMIDESLNAYDLKFTWEKGKLGNLLFRGCGQMMCEIVDKLPSLSF